MYFFLKKKIMSCYIFFSLDHQPPRTCTKRKQDNITGEKEEYKVYYIMCSMESHKKNKRQGKRDGGKEKNSLFSEKK